MLANGRVSGKAHRWIATLGSGFIRGIKEMRYVRGEDNWMADALSRLGDNPLKEKRMDSLVHQCLDFFFGKNQGVEKELGNEVRDSDEVIRVMEEGEEEEAEDCSDLIGEMSREGRE